MARSYAPLSRQSAEAARLAADEAAMIAEMAS